MIAVDTNPSSPFRDSVYVAWDNASLNQGKSSSNSALLFSRSTDGGKTFSAPDRGQLADWRSEFEGAEFTSAEWFARRF